MRKYPFIKQSGLRDCGPACILMILKYYGGYVSLDKLSTLLSINNKGTSVYSMVECLKYLGFDSSAYKFDNITLIKYPCIAHMHYDINNHYVVIFEINLKKNFLIIGDPNKRILKISFDEFKNTWSGIIIEAKPIGLIIKEKEPKVFNFIISLIKENILLFLIIGLLSILICFLSIIISFFLQISITNSINYFIISFLVTLIIKSVLEYIRNNFLLKFNYKIDKYLSKDTFRNIINLPYISSKNKTSGELISYYNDLFNIKNLLSYIFLISFISIPLIIILSVLLFIMSYKLFILNIFILLLYFLIYLYYHKRKYYLSDEVLKNKAILNSYISENINSFETINNLNIKDKIINNFEDKYQKYVIINKKLEKMKNKEFLYKELAFDISLLMLLWFISKDSNNFITIYFLFNLLNTSFKELLEFDGNLSNIVSSIKHIQEIPKNNLKSNININGDIIVKKLHKKFNNKLVLKGIDLNISKGEKVFVTGKSGSGKSTLFKIIKGYYEYEGNCTIDIFECNKYNFTNVLYVSSHEYLFTGRVIDNLSIINYNSINKEICEVINEDDEFIYENGFNLSTGQKQRIALARALNNFNIIIIDEGLEDVDINMERRIIKRLFKYYKDKTFIYISHRLDNLDLFDRLIKIEDGRIFLDEKRNI